jgi:nucleoside-diphosphate-sugar epimerase
MVASVRSKDARMTATAFTWSNRKVLVTGCTGFLGSAVVRELLGRGAEVIGLVRDRAGEAALTRNQLNGRVRVVRGRVEDLFRIHSALAIHEVQAVFHLTGPVGGDQDLGIATVIEAIRRYDLRTPVVTARPTGAPPLHAQPPVLPAVARLGEIFGRGDRSSDRIVPQTILGLLGSGDSNSGAIRDGRVRDLVFVDDAARACVMLAEAIAARPEPRLRDVTFTSGWEKTDQQLIAMIRDLFAGRSAPSLAAEAPPNPVGWSPEVGFTDALARTIAWYRDPTGAYGSKASQTPSQLRSAA